MSELKVNKNSQSSIPHSLREWRNAIMVVVQNAALYFQSKLEDDKLPLIVADVFYQSHKNSNPQLSILKHTSSERIDETVSVQFSSEKDMQFNLIIWRQELR